MRTGYFGVLVLIIVSFVLLINGVHILIKKKKYWILVGYLSFVLGYPLFMYLLFNTEFLREMPKPLAFTIGVIAATVSLLWLLSGFFVNRTAEDIK